MNRQYTEEEMRLCPHLQKKFTADSPFKEKITINSESEATPAKPLSKPEIPAECPYSKKGAKTEPKKEVLETPKAVRRETTAATQVKEASSDEEDQPAGGCPVMNTNPKKANPGYFVPELVDSEVYVSPFASVLESNSIFGPLSRDKKATRLWDKYPIFLKHTLVYMGENYDKYRKLEVGYKFFVTDELREKGNACYRKGKYQEALSHYEKAASIMRWLEFTPDEFVQQMKKLPRFTGEGPVFKEDMTVEDIDRIKRESTRAAKEQEQKAAAPAPRDQKYYDERLNDLLLTSLADANVKLVEGHELKERADQDIQENILFQLYSNMSMCYLKLKNLTEARQAVEEMGRIKNDSSLFLFRQAQILAADKRATLAELRLAQAGMREALELKRTEKIFEHNPNFLRIFSLENHETVFPEMLSFVDGRVARKKQETGEALAKVLRRVKQIEQAEASIIARGLVPEEGRERTLLLFSQDDQFEHKLLGKMEEKYRQAIAFFSASEKEEDAGQVEIAQRCLIKLYELVDQVNLLWEFDFATKDRTLQAIIAEVNAEFGIGFDSEKTQKRLKRVQREQARELIEKFPFDLKLFEYVVQGIFKEDKERKEKEGKKAEVERRVGQESEVRVAEAKGGSGYGFVLQLVAMAVFLLVVAFLGKSLMKPAV